jgi:hypothetical protein
VILVGELGFILHGRLHIGALDRQRCEVSFVLRRSLRLRWTIIQSAIAAVIANPCGIEIIGDPVVVNIADNTDVHHVHRRVVVEVLSAPIAAFIAVAVVAEPIIHAAIEADVRSPVAVVPAIMPAVITPIARRPKHSDIRRHHPRARDPVIAAIV